MTDTAAVFPDAIFLGGLAHTGKTQLRTALTAVDGVEIFRETRLLKLDGSRFGDLSMPANLERCLTELESREPLPSNRSELIEAFRAGPARFEALVALIYGRRATDLGAERWGLQMASLEAWAAVLLDLLPRARMIHLIRHPARHVTDRAGSRRLKRTVELARWRQSAELGIELLALHPDRYRIVRTEDLARDPHSVIGEICDFLRVERVPDAIIDEVDWSQLLVGGTDRPLDPITAATAGRLGFEHSGVAATLGWRMGRLPGRIAWHIVKLKKGRALV